MARMVNTITGSAKEVSDPKLLLLYQRLDDQIDQLQNAASTAASWNALSAAARQEATRQTVLVTVRLARLLIGRLEAN